MKFTLRDLGSCRWGQIGRVGCVQGRVRAALGGGGDLKSGDLGRVEGCSQA